jgi:hypothetical protein
MDADQLFIATLDDLEARSEPGRDEYNVLGTAALLRKLLLDSSRLVDIVNRQRRIRIRYVANRRQPPTDPPPIFWSVQDGLDPTTARPGSQPEELSLDQLLSVTIIRVEGVDLNVRDVVDYLANVAGAVHIGQPRTAQHAALASVEASISVGGYPPAVRSLLAVARVVSRALQPLRAAIVADGVPNPPTTT